MINMQLAKERGLNKETVEQIMLCQGFLDDILNNPDILIESPNDIPSCIEECEYNLQGLWGFKKSKKFHRYQYKVKWCTCPSMDNEDMIGWTEKRYINADCPYHGTNPALTWDDKRFQE